MKNKTFAYICAPGKNNTAYSRALCDMGYVPITPKAMFSYLSDKVPEQREAKKRMSQLLLRRCRAVVVCSDVITEEMEEEIMLAKRHGIITTTLAGITKISKHTETGEEE